MLKVFPVSLMAVIELSAIIQGYQIISGNPKMVSLFGKWRMETDGMGYFGSLILVCVVFIPFPQTFLIGNLLLAAVVTLVLYLQLSLKRYKDSAFQLTFFLLILVLITLKYPF